MRRIRIIVVLLLGGLAARVDAGEPKVVDNPARGLWDEEPRRNFHLLEDLYVACDDEENGLIFGRISDIAVDSRDRMLILDGGFSCVKVYDPDSMIVHTIGRKGEGPGEFNRPTAVGVDAEDRIYVASQGAARKGVRIIADGGIVKSGDIVKALTLAHAVICGGLFAGCDETPGEIVEIGGKRYKQYRGMGSLAAMNAGSASRYGHDKKDTTRKYTPEGIEALKEVSGTVDKVVAELIGGVQSGMGYLGAANLEQLRVRARYVRVSSAGQKEASPHDVIEIKAQKSGS